MLKGDRLDVGWLREWAKYLGARLLQLREGPAALVDPAMREAFEGLWASAGEGQAIEYHLPYPKHQFLRYLVENHEVILHGTNRPDLTRLEPRRQTTFLGRQVEAVFATPDEIWCLFYAVVNGRGFQGSKWNICLRVSLRGRVRKFYCFSLSRPMLARSDAFCTGYVYILPRATFQQGEIADEWTSSEAVTPLAKLAVAPEEFPFLTAIEGHPDTGSPLRLYSRRLWPRRAQ